MGEYCPEIEHAPQTIEGLLVMKAADRSGVWRRAGMDGVIFGMNTGEALLSLPSECNRDVARDLISYVERGFLKGLNNQGKSE